MLEGTALLTQVEGVDYRELPESPTPEEFFLLSRVRGQVSVEQLCSASGLGREKTMMAIDRLVHFGLLEVVGGSSAGSTGPVHEGSSKSVPEPVIAGRVEAGDSGAVEAGPDSKTYDPPVQSSPRFETRNSRAQAPRGGAAVIAEDDDDLFMPDSIAHISKISHPVRTPEAVSGQPRERSTQTGGKSSGVETPAASDDEVDRAPPRVSSAVVVEDDDALFSVADSSGDSEARVAQSDSDGLEAKTEKPESTDPTTSKKSKSKRKTRPDFSRFPESFDDFEVSDADLGEASDVEPELKREILFVHQALESVSHYDLFGVETDASRKEIRSSYFVLSKRYHPDLFFRKDAGEFATMVEVIFKTVTKAYQVLSNKNKRREYDQLLAEQSGAVEGVGQAESDPEERRRMAVQLLIQRASKRENEGDFLGAAESLKKAYSVEPSLNLAQKCATLYLRAGKRLDDAAMFARAVVRERPEDPAGFVLLGRIYEKDQALIEALDAYEEALSRASDDPTIQVHVERLRSKL